MLDNDIFSPFWFLTKKLAKCSYMKYRKKSQWVRGLGLENCVHTLKILFMKDPKTLFSLQIIAYLFFFLGT
jgi:hypothetical protein